MKITQFQTVLKMVEVDQEEVLKGVTLDLRAGAVAEIEAAANPKIKKLLQKELDKLDAYLIKIGVLTPPEVMETTPKYPPTPDPNANIKTPKDFKEEAAKGQILEA